MFKKACKISSAFIHGSETDFITSRLIYIHHHDDGSWKCNTVNLKFACNGYNTLTIY